MEHEKFNPSDPKYKEVKDLPETVRDRYSDLPSGGFVRKSAEKGLAEAGEWVDRKPDIWSVGRLSRFLGMDSHIHSAISRKLREGAEEQVPVEALIENAKNLVYDQVFVAMYEEMQKKLKELGKTGHVVTDLGGWYSSYGCRTMWGEVDGVKLKAHFNCSESEPSVLVDTEYVGKEMARDILSKYIHVALDKEKVRAVVSKLVEKIEEEVRSRYAGQKDMAESVATQQSQKYWKKEDEESRKKQEKKDAAINANVNKLLG